MKAYCKGLNSALGAVNFLPICRPRKKVVAPNKPKLLHHPSIHQNHNNMALTTFGCVVISIYYVNHRRIMFREGEEGVCVYASKKETRGSVQNITGSCPANTYNKLIVL